MKVTRKVIKHSAGYSLATEDKEYVYPYISTTIYPEDKILLKILALDRRIKPYDVLHELIVAAISKTAIPPKIPVSVVAELTLDDFDDECEIEG